MEAKNIQELFGTLTQSIVTGWRKHLKSDNYNEHVILNDFYDDMLDAVDALIEGYMSYKGKVNNYVNLLKDAKDMTPLEYLNTLHEITKKGKSLLDGKSELESAADDILSVIDTAIYKLKELVHKNTNESLYEHLTRVYK